MHGQQNDKYTEMHGQQNDKYTEMQGQQNVKKINCNNSPTNARYLYLHSSVTLKRKYYNIVINVRNE